MSKILTKISFKKKLPKIEIINKSKTSKQLLFIVDQTVLKKNKSVALWIKNQPFIYSVEAGENLKNINNLPFHLNSIFNLLGNHAQRNLTLVAIGGGTVGDFAGFIASVFKRGINLIQIPSTWLAVIDSAHGGKNGLNLGDAKNQIGTIYHPQKVFIIEGVLKSQSSLQLEDSLGELYKMALLTSDRWGQNLINLKKINKIYLNQYLPLVIKEKYKFVKLDPNETRGIRQFLNLGHTFGHVLELERQIPHGRAVAIGLKFALQFSFDKGLLKSKTWKMIQTTPMYQFLCSKTVAPISEIQFTKILLQDKKKASIDSIQFVFLKDFGKPILNKISIEELITAGKKYDFIA